MTTRRRPAAAAPAPPRTGYHLKREQKQALLEQLLDSLRAERYQAELDLKRWSAIPEEHRDGAEEEAIAGARRRIAICEAEIDALTKK